MVEVAPSAPSSAAQASVPRLEMRGIRKRFGATAALQGVDFQVFPGEVHALVGENGAGKSTLMKILSGAERPDAGVMFLDGEPFLPLDPREARLRGIGMIYQELSLADHLTVEENIALGLEPTRWGLLRRREIRDRAQGALKQMGHSDILPWTPTRRLGVAERQIVEIARSLVSGCRVLILDEPTSSLARGDVARLFELVGRLRDHGQAVIYISHFLEEVKQVSSRITVLRDGMTAGGGRTDETTAAAMVGMMVGRRIEHLYPRAPRQPGAVVLETRGLSGRKKPEFAGLTLRRGEVLGIAGLVGAGRTELLRTIFGLDPVRCGAVKVGAFSGPPSPARRLRQGVGFLSEDRKGEGLALNLSVMDNLTMSRLSKAGSLGWVSPSFQRGATAAWVQRLGIKCRHPGQRVSALSGGNQQKVALARLLHHDVDVLLLDEPTRGIDVASKVGLYEVIDELARGSEGREPRAVLVVSSYFPELLGICDRIGVMCRGVLGDIRPTSEWSEPALLLEAAGQGGA